MSEEFIHKGWSVSHLPRKYPREAYDRAREEVIAKVSKNPDVMAVMDFGVEQYPGISDIDFYIIFRDTARHMYIPMWPDYSDDTSYLMMHTTLLLSEEFIAELRYLNPWSIYAKERYLFTHSDFTKPTIKELAGIDPILSAAFMVDKIESILATLPSYVIQRLPVRNIFELCKNCIYNIWRLEDLNIPVPAHFNAFISDFNDLREHWFTLPQEQALDRLIGLYRLTLSCTFEIAWLLDAWLADKVVSKPTSDMGIRRARWPYTTPWQQRGNVMYVHTYKYARMFTDSITDPAVAMKLSAEAGERVRIDLGPIQKTVVLTPVILPWNLSAFVTSTIMGKGILSSALLRDTWTNTRTVPVIETSSLEYRIQQQNKLTQTYRSKRIPGGEGKGYVYANQIYGYLFGEERFARKILMVYLRQRFLHRLRMAYRNHFS